MRLPYSKICSTKRIDTIYYRMTDQTHPKPEARKYRNKLELVIFIVFVLLCLAIIASGLLDIVMEAGNHKSPYPGESLVADYVSGVLWAVTLGVCIFFWPVPSRHRRALMWIWLVKAFVALVFMLAYEYVYFMDPDGYFHNAAASDFIWRGFNFSNGSYTIQQLTWLHLKIVPNSYHAAKVGFAMVSMVGVYLFYRAAVIFLQREDIRILYIMALFPGILFWSSILGKDPITLLGFSLYVYGVVAWQQLRQSWHCITLLLGILVASSTRIWLAPIMVAPLLVFIVSGRRDVFWRLVLVGLCVLVFTLSLPKIMTMWRVSTVEDLFAFRSYAAGAFEGGGSSLMPPKISGFSDFIRYLPIGIFTALFRPLPWDVRNLFGFLQGMDGLILLFLLFLAVKRTHLKELGDPIILWAIMLVLTWAAFYGLVTFNFGTLVRYKLQILPILLGLLMFFSRRRTAPVLIEDDSSSSEQ